MENEISESIQESCCHSVDEVSDSTVFLCKWCRSDIVESASFCKECGLWQSSFRQWVSPTTILSMIGAAAAWSAVLFQALPSPPNPVMVAAKAVEALEQKAEIGCTKNKTNECIWEFWRLYSVAQIANDAVAQLDARNEFRRRTKTVVNSVGHEYVELYEFEPLN